MDICSTGCIPVELFGAVTFTPLAMAGGGLFSLSTLGLSPSSPPYHRRSDHLPRFAEAAAGPEDVIFVLVAAPVLVGRGSTTSAVLCEGGGGIYVTGEEEEGGPENSSATLPRVLLKESGTFIIEGLDHSPGDGYGISFPIDIDAETVREIPSFVR